MALKVGEFFAELKLDDAGFDQSLNKAHGNLGAVEQQAGRTESRIGNLAKTMGAVAVGGAVALGGALVGAAFATAKHGDEIAKSARRAGVGAESYQELEYALGQVGIEQGTVNRLLERNTQRLGRAAEGNEKLQGAYADLGVEIHDANGELRASEDVFDDVMRSLAGIEDPARRAALAGELLGTKAGRELAGALDDGIEGIDELRGRAHDLGIVLSDDTLDAAEQFNDAVDDVKRALTGIVHDIGARVLPAITPFIESLADWLPGAINRAVDGLSRIADFLSGPISWAFDLARDGILTFIQAIQGDWTDDSQVRPLHRALGMIGSVIHDEVIPAVQSVAAWFMDTALPAIRDFATQAQGFISDTLVPAFQSFIDDILPRLQDLSDWFTGTALPAIQNFATQVSEFFTDTILPAVQDFMDWVLPKLEEFKEWFLDTGVPSALEAIGDAFDSVMDAAQPVFEWLEDNKDTVLAGLAGMLTAVVVPAFIAWTASVWASVAAHIAAAAAWLAAYLPIIAIVAGVGIAVAALYKAWDSNFLGIQEITAEVWEFVQPILLAIWERLQEFIDVVLPAFADAWEFLRENIPPILEMVWETIQTVFESIKEFLEDHSETIKAVLNGAWEIIESSIATTVDIIEGIIVAFLALIQGDWETAWEAVKAIADSVWEHLETVFGNVRDFVVGAFETLTSRADELISNWADDVRGYVRGLRDDVISFIKTMVSDTWTAITDWVSDVIGRATDLYNDVTKWVSDMVSDVIQFYVDLVKETWETFNDWVGDIIGAAKDLYDDVTDWISDLVTDVVQFFVELARDAWGKWDGLVSDVVTAAGELVTDVMAEIEALPNKIIEVFANAGEWLLEAGKDIIGGLVSGIQDAIPGVDDVLGGVTDKIPDWKGPPERDKKLLSESGHMIMQGFQAGLESEWRNVARRLGEMTNEIDISPSLAMPAVSSSIPAPQLAMAGSSDAGAAMQGQIRDMLNSMREMNVSSGMQPAREIHAHLDFGGELRTVIIDTMTGEMRRR